jgi:hypothetical protein
MRETNFSLFTSRMYRVISPLILKFVTRWRYVVNFKLMSLETRTERGIPEAGACMCPKTSPEIFEKKNLSPLSAFEPLAIQPIASRYNVEDI